MGVDVNLVFAVLFAVGSALSGLAGLMAGPILAVQVGMGEPILILALVVTVIGGIGMIKGAFVAALIVGIVDTFGRVLSPPALGSMVIFLLMSLILAFRPERTVPRSWLRLIHIPHRVSTGLHRSSLSHCWPPSHLLRNFLATRS